MPTTLDVYFPFDSGDGASVLEDDWRKMAKNFLSSGVISGELNAFLPVGTGVDGLAVQVRSGHCWINGHFGEHTTDELLAISPNLSGSTRLDRAIIRLDTANNRIELDVLEGTTVVPTLTQTLTTYEMSLAIISVADSATAIDAGDVIDERLFAGDGTRAAGIVEWYSGLVVPDGYLPADGRAVARDQYARLYSTIFTIYGSGDGSTTFNVPDLRGRAPVGIGQGAGLTSRGLAEQFGSETHQLTEAELPSHDHTMDSSGANHRHAPGGNEANYVTFTGNILDTSRDFNLNGGGGPIDIYNTQTGTANANHTHNINDAGSDSPHANVQPSLGLMAVVKT